MKGTITFSEQALASLVGLTAHEIPGVVGMSASSLKDGILKILGRGQASEGVLLRKQDGSYHAELFVVMAFGVSIPTVASNIEERVLQNVKQKTGHTLNGVTVHVMGVSKNA